MTAIKPEPAPSPQIKIETMDDLQRMLTIAKGGDPNAIQAVANFMNLKSNIERSYFPDKKTSIAIAQLTGYGRTYYPSEDWNPFDMVADALSVAFMPYKGFKSNQFVDMTRQTHDLAGLETIAEDTTRGVMDRILGRKKE
ncbi:unnamed protein product, partial [marine sediment metagenome]